MGIKRVRWLMVLLVAAAGGVNFLLKILSGDTQGDAAIVLTFQPVLGKTTMARGAAFDLKVQEVSGSRSAPTAWDKFNQLGRKTLVLPLDTADGTVEVAGSAATLDKLESRLFEQAAENLLT
ncbi:hypothetical protein [Arthrobacter sp. Leaf141]|uniref:hypothetical protein n=1 Tax=Arthrobacter sp. Leaf141 TaxID=1736273 RepID=UPI000AC7C395|nr:hypothetical protein [Arthrobacter sp. Leaf141]